MGLISFFQDLFGITARREREENLQRSRDRAEETRRLLAEEARRVSKSNVDSVLTYLSRPSVQLAKPSTERINPVKSRTVRPKPPENVSTDADFIASAASPMAHNFSEPEPDRHFYAPPVDHSPSHHSSWSSHDSGSSSSSDSGGGDGGGGGGD